MLQYKEPLSKRNKAETGIRYEWYAMQRWGAKYWEDFSKPKIVFQEIVQESQFFYDMDGRFICNDTCRIIVGKELSFLLGVLNSKLFFYAIKHFYGGGVLGEHGIRMKHTFFQNFPCIQYNSTIDKLVKELTEKENAKVENQIGNKIYNLYGLTPQEIQMVEE